MDIAGTNNLPARKAPSFSWHALEAVEVGDRVVFRDGRAFRYAQGALVTTALAIVVTVAQHANREPTTLEPTSVWFWAYVAAAAFGLFLATQRAAVYFEVDRGLNQVIATGPGPKETTSHPLVTLECFLCIERAIGASVDEYIYAVDRDGRLLKLYPFGIRGQGRESTHLLGRICHRRAYVLQMAWGDSAFTSPKETEAPLLDKKKLQQAATLLYDPASEAR